MTPVSSSRPPPISTTRVSAGDHPRLQRGATEGRGRIRDIAVDRLAQAVASAEVDLSVGPDSPPAEGVSLEPVFNSPWVLWCSPRHPLAARKILRWDQLHDVALVSASRDHERSVAQMHLNAPEGERVRPVDVVDNVTTALGLAAEGLAATLAPAYVGVLARKFDLVMRRVTQPETIRQICVYRPTNRSIPPAAEAFSEFLVGRLRTLDAAQRSARRK